MLVILSASGYGFLQSNSKVGYMLTENAPIDPGQDPNHNVPHVTPSPLEHSTVDYRHTSGNPYVSLKLIKWHIVICSVVDFHLFPYVFLLCISIAELFHISIKNDSLN